MKKQQKRSDCPIGNSLDIFGDKWSLLIIRDLMFFGKETYGDFLKSDEKIATNILASRLQTLEEHNIIKKLPHPDSKAKVLYRLTQRGIDLLPILVEISLWAEKHLLIPQSIEIRENQTKESFIQELTQKLESFLEEKK